MKNIIISFLIILSAQLKSQNIDSLIAVLPKQKGIEKAQNLIDLCYYLSTSNINQSIIYGNQALQIAQGLNNELFLAGCQNDLSLSYYYKGDYDSCIYLAEQAYITRLKNKKIRDAGASLSKVALGYYEKGKYIISLEKNIEAARLFQESGSLLEAAKLQNNIGSIYERNNQLPEAKNMYLQSAKATLEVEDYEGYVSAKSNYGIILKKQDSLKKAFEVFYDLLEVTKKHCKQEYLAQIYQVLGTIERQQNQTKKGLEYYLKAKEIYDRIGSLNGIAIINVNIGNCYADLKDFTKGEQFLKEGLQLAIEIKSLLWQRTAYFGLYDLEKMKNNFSQATTYLEKYQAINDSIYNQENQSQLLALQTQFEVQEKENKILVQQNEIIQQEVKVKQRNIAITLLLVVLLITGIVVQQIIQKNKLKKKQVEIDLKNKLQKERVRISRDLHDNLGAELSIISSQLDIKAMNEDDLKNKQELDKLADNVRKTSSLMRDTIWAINNEELSTSQLGIKTKEFAEKAFNQTQTKVIFQNQLPDTIISPENALTIYRVFQEIINNAAKYSKASEFSIVFKQEHKTAQFELFDNGIGFDTQTVKKNYGLNNIKERLQSIKANYTLQSEPNKGTIYRIVLEL